MDDIETTAEANGTGPTLEALKQQTLRQADAEISAVLAKHKVRLVAVTMIAEGQVQTQITLKLNG